jgi:hypothetical protein
MRPETGVLDTMGVLPPGGIANRKT